MLRSAAIILSTLVLFCMSLGAASAQVSIEEMLGDCSNEINAYCSSVTPGGGRLFHCAKAHQDKLSSECIYAINRASYWLEFVASTLTYVASQCEVDAIKYCPDVKLGEERVLNCLRENEENLNKHCDTALRDIGKQ